MLNLSVFSIGIMPAKVAARQHRRLAQRFHERKRYGAAEDHILAAERIERHINELEELTQLSLAELGDAIR